MKDQQCTNVTLLKKLNSLIYCLTNLATFITDPVLRRKIRKCRNTLRIEADELELTLLKEQQDELTKAIKAVEELTKEADEAAKDIDKVANTINKAAKTVQQVEKYIDIIAGVVA